MNAAMANAAIFVPTTLMPAAAAERSFARTANMALPSALRRSNATASAAPISTTRTMRQNAGRGYSDPVPGPSASPNSFGSVTDLPAVPTRSVFLNHTAWTVTASDSVTIANGKPRIRKAGIPTTTPITVAPSAATIGASGNGTPQSVVSVPEQEGRDAGEGELRQRDLPRVPGHHDDRQRDDPEDERRDQRRTPRSCRHEDRDDARRRAHERGAGEVLGTRRARQSGADDLARDGSGLARTTSTTRINNIGTSSASPDDGSHECCVFRYVASDCSIPIASPAPTATPRLLNPATIAAASAGTMKSVYEYGTSGVMGAIKMPAMPAMTALITQFTAAMRSGEMWETYAPFSLSAAARVCNPNRVNR